MKVPVNGGSRPHKKMPQRVSWQEYWAVNHPEQNPHGEIRDLIEDEMLDAYISRNKWEERIEI